jgi:serine/threonine-protein kinase
MSTGNGTLLESEKYHVIRELGRGGMGVVYLAEDRQLRRRVALKVLYDYLNRDRAFVERFQEEACSVSTLHHPNIVCVHGLDRSGEVVAIDMEFVEGVSLDQVTVVTPHIAAAIARDVLGGLAACHQIGVIHRDIKPSNILVSQVGQAKITDFGLATAYVSHIEATMPGSTSSGFYMGTPRYMPIQAWEGKDPEPFWDLYSFGVVLHELVSGRPAFPGANPLEVMRKQLTDTLPALSSIDRNVSPEFSELVNFLLSAGRERAGKASAVSAVSALDRLRRTPEYRTLNEIDSVTTVALPPAALKKRKATRAKRAPLSWRRAALALGVAVVVALTLYGAAKLSGNHGGVMPETPGPANTASQNTTPAATSVEDGAAIRFFDISTVNNEQFLSTIWMVETDARGEPQRVTALSPSELWVFTVNDETGSSRKTIQGFWCGGPSGPNATGHHGTITGTLLWEPEHGRVAAHASRVRSRDNTKMDFSFAGRLNQGSYTRENFVQELESNSVLQTLLYRELLARSLPWATEVEAMMPAFADGRTIVPFVPIPVVPDGFLDESLWNQPQFNTSGRVGEISAATSEGSKLLARWGEEGIHLGLRVATIGGSPRFELGVLPAPEISVMDAGRFFAAFDESGRAESRYVQSSREQPWECDWKGRVLENSEGLAVEIQIPFTSLKSSAKPEKGKRWRLNARLTSSQPDGTRHVDVIWGATEFTQLEHGTILIFDQ